MKHIPGFAKEGVFFEQIADEKYVCGKELEEKQVFQHNSVTYQPLERCPWTLATKAEKFAGFNTLRKEIRQFVYDHLYLTESTLYDVLTAWIMATWLREIWTVVPYIFFQGLIGSGKTRGLEILQRLSFRGILASNISPAALYRASEEWHPTILLDETEIYNKETKSEITGLLNSGYKKGQYALRVKVTKEGAQLETFDVFGFKALAGTYGLKKALESRSIFVYTIKAQRKINRLIDENQATDLRNKLLGWRLETLGDNALSAVSALFLDIGYGLDFGDGRLQELFSCLLAVADEAKDKIIEHARKIDKIKSSEETASEEAEIVQILLSKGVVSEKDMALTKDVAEKFNESRNDKEKWKTRSIGWIMRRLGFTKMRTGKNKGWNVDQDRLNDLAQIYAIENGEETTYASSPEERQKRQNGTKIDVDQAFNQLQCFDCRKILIEETPFTHYDGKPFCFLCFNKIEAQKKKKDWICSQLVDLEGSPFCNVIQSLLAKPEGCSPDCNLLEIN